MSLSSPLRVLLVEDSINDTFLVVRELERGGLEVEFERVETAQYMEAALEQKTWDLVIFDCGVSQLDGVKALEIYRRKQLEIPLILISGLAKEGQALEMLKCGAHDYVPKDNLARLAPAVRRELQNAEQRQLGRKAGEPAMG